MKIKLNELALLLKGQVAGDESVEITGIAKIDEAKEGELSFIANPKYIKYLETTLASAVLVSPDFPVTEKTVIRVPNPYYSFVKAIQLFCPSEETLQPGIHPTAVIGEGTKVGKCVAIGAYVVIGRQCRIGNKVKIHPGVTISDRVEIGDNSLLYSHVSLGKDIKLGKNVIVHYGAVIGSDGFGFAKEGGIYHKIPQMGTVVIEDDVEIGANCTIDRATLGETRIRRGTKLDNLIQVAHNVEIGENTVIAAQTGISGSTKIGSGVRIGGQVGFVGHIEVGDNATVGAQTGVNKSVSPNTMVSGYPARPHMQWCKEEAALHRLPDLLKRVRDLEEKLKELEVPSQKKGKENTSRIQESDFA